MRRATLARSAFLLALALPGAARAQEPAGSGPPPAGEEKASGAPAHELLPGLGKLGAQVGVSLGASWNPFLAGRGLLGGAYVDLPVLGAPGGTISYELLMVVSHAGGDPFTVADAAPSRLQTRLRLLQISPFALKYTQGRGSVRPYLTAGGDVIAVFSRWERGASAEAPELAARGLPTGQADLRLGGHAGAGVELRAGSSFSLNLDYRFTRIEGRNGSLHAVTGSLGLHW